jgi:hypothetical protein
MEESTEEMLKRVGKNRLLQVSEGLKILARYTDDKFAVSAEHDVICAGPTKATSVVSKKDQAVLKKLNWNVYGDDPDDPDYDSEPDEREGRYYFFP